VIGVRGQRGNCTRAQNRVRKFVSEFAIAVPMPAPPARRRPWASGVPRPRPAHAGIALACFSLHEFFFQATSLSSSLAVRLPAVSRSHPRASVITASLSSCGNTRRPRIVLAAARAADRATDHAGGVNTRNTLPAGLPDHLRASGQREESEEVDAFTDKTEMKGKITSLPGSAGVLC
jgi:hypothetical protein